MAQARSVGEAVELQHGGLEAEVEARHREEGGFAGARVREHDDRPVGPRREAVAVGVGEVVGAAEQRPGGCAEAYRLVVEGDGDARREVGRVADERLEGGGERVVQGRRRVVARAYLAFLVDGEAQHGAPQPGAVRGVELVAREGAGHEAEADLLQRLRPQRLHGP
jgi:hypothetical protein